MSMRLCQKKKKFSVCDRYGSRRSRGSSKELNETARAGEAGRGFEVVAQEIETLARNTSDAANEIQVMGGDVVEAVAGLDKLAEQMLSFLRNEISGMNRELSGYRIDVL